MIIKKNKFRILIGLPLIISSSYSYSLNNASKLTETHQIDLTFDEIAPDDLNRYPSNKHIHGRMDPRSLPKILSSPYQNIMIISDENKTEISYDSGYKFNELKIKDFSHITALALTNNGRYLTAHGKYKNKNQFFIYDTYLNKTHPFNNKNDISYHIDDNYVFTTTDGLFSLYSEYTDNTANKKNYFIFDIEKNQTFSLQDINNTGLNNHIEKNRFTAFNHLNFIDKVINLKPQLTASSYSGKYVYGFLDRKEVTDNKVKVAFIYDTSKDVVNMISKSDYGSSRINAVSHNDIFVGWEEWLVQPKNKTHQKLIRRLFYYQPSKGEMISPLISSGTDHYNSEAMDISEKGDFLIGWAEDGGYKKNGLPSEAAYYRRAFAYSLQEKQAQFLPNLTNTVVESEAHSISEDGNTVFGVEKDSAGDKWVVVAWDLERVAKSDLEHNNANEKIEIKYDKLLAEKNIDAIKNASTITENKLLVLKNKLVSKKENLEKELNNSIENRDKSLKKIDEITKLIDEEDRLGGSASWERNRAELSQHEDAEKEHQKQAENIRKQLNALNNSDEGKQLTQLNFESTKINQALKALGDSTEIKPSITNEEAERQRLADEKAVKEKQLADEKAAKEKQLAEEKAAKEKQLADEKAAKEKQFADEKAAKEKQLADEKAAAERQRLADKKAAKEKQLADEKAAKEKQLADEKAAKEKQLADEKAAKEKLDQGHLAKEQAEKLPVVTEIKENKPTADKVKEKLPVEDIAKDKPAVIPTDTNKAIEKLPTDEPTVIEKSPEQKEPVEAPSTLKISKPIEVINTLKTMQLSAENGYKLIDLQQGQLRYLASATCDIGEEKACIRGFAHYQHVSKANATQTGISAAYRVDLGNTPLVMGLAIDTDAYTSLPDGYDYDGYPLPLIGFSLDFVPSLNKASSNNALHLSFKGAYLNRKVSIKRPQLKNTEAGEGDARLSGYHLELQGYYPFAITPKITLTPFGGLTFNEMSRSAYSEKSDIAFVAHYEKLNEHALMAKFGLGIDYLLMPSLTLNAKAGMYWQLAQHQRDFRSHVDGLGPQRTTYEEDKKQQKQRPFSHIGLRYQLDKNAAIGTSANWEMSTYRNNDLQFDVSYTYRF